MHHALAALLILTPSLALAHCELRGSSPAEGARLTAPPTEILLRCNEPVQVTFLRLLDAAGQPLPLRRAGDASPRREERAAPAAPRPRTGNGWRGGAHASRALHPHRGLAHVAGLLGGGGGGLGPSD